jgi:hypothetical protein
MSADPLASTDGPVEPSGCRLVDSATHLYPDCRRVTSFTYLVKPEPPFFTFEHDKQKGIFILTGPDGKTEHFRDNPARHLLVEPDPETGAMRPVIKRGKPSYLYLCREERESDRLPVSTPAAPTTVRSALGSN